MIYIFFSVLPESAAFFTAVRLTPKATAAAVKVGYSISSFVLTFLTTTDTPFN